MRRAHVMNSYLVQDVKAEPVKSVAAPLRSILSGESL